MARWEEVIRCLGFPEGFKWNKGQREPKHGKEEQNWVPSGPSIQSGGWRVKGQSRHRLEGMMGTRSGAGGSAIQIRPASLPEWGQSDGQLEDTTTGGDGVCMARLDHRSPVG